MPAQTSSSVAMSPAAKYAPPLPPRKLPGTNAQVGVLRANHPEPVGQAEKPSQQSTARLAGAPAFLDVMLRPEFETVYGEGPWEEAIWEDTLWGGDVMSPPSWALLWRDQDGHPLKREYVQLADGVTMKDALVRAVTEYDRNETARINAYNQQLLINAARRRIVKWAEDGSRANPRVDDEDRLTDSDIEKFNLAVDCVKETAQLLHDIAADVRVTPPHPLSL
ncbi:hypothetical protein BHE90_015485 [Fusarium euwallaceae]|uniref:Uncharacterized protein n=1 Tax=Fusarium euwallaceae TaxID=1147111 RepID=A0A430L340_9HYPO|nr:hypothetical protein BHE90_015485 [Fusarium euwallaceae]